MSKKLHVEIILQQSIFSLLQQRENLCVLSFSKSLKRENFCLSIMELCEVETFLHLQEICIIVIGKMLPYQQGNFYASNMLITPYQ